MSRGLYVSAENVEMTDYVKEGDIGFKKPKVRCSISYMLLMLTLAPQNKKKRSARRMAEISDVADIAPDGDQMQVDVKPIVRQRNLDSNFVDDDELQAALARSRRAKTQKPKKLSPEELARRSKSFCQVYTSSCTDVACV